MKRFVGVMILVYTGLLLYWMFWGFGRTTHEDYRYNFAPFSTIYYFISSEDVSTYQFITNLFGNIGLFVPYGIAMTAFFGSLKKSIIIFCAGLLVAETLQLISKKGVFDIDDIILNITGFAVGYALFRRIVYNQRTNFDV
ncbi:MAG: VanZ family protein [Synergistaceae bacterium]|jgi:glycopeptide antibiotics resistance protein|nr:VanZ family protein [Synergistaceae bacterium]